jgi:hypothetical protein
MRSRLTSGDSQVSGDRARQVKWQTTALSRGRPQPPQLLAADDLERLTETERGIYDEARADYHNEVLLVATPDIRQITATGPRADRVRPVWHPQVHLDHPARTQAPDRDCSNLAGLRE